MCSTLSGLAFQHERAVTRALPLAIHNSYVNREEKRHPFEPGQKLLRRVGPELVPVTFIAVSPRTAVFVGTQAVTNASPTAIVRSEDGGIQSVPIDEFNPESAGGVSKHRTKQ